MRSIIFVKSEASICGRRIYLAKIAAEISEPGLIAFDDDQLLKHCEKIIDKSLGEPIFIDIKLNLKSDFSLVRSVWNKLTCENFESITFRISLIEKSNEESFFLKQLTIDLDDHQPIPLQNKLEALMKDDASSSGVVMTRHAPFFWPSKVQIIFLTTRPQEAMFFTLRELTIKRDTQIVFLRNSLPNLHERIGRDFWKQVFASEIPKVFGFDETFKFTSLRLFECSQPTTLFVFPERMLPLGRAYYLRAFDMLLGLNYGGEACAVMILGPNNTDLERIQRALEVVSPFVFTHPLSRGSFPPHHDAVRKTEKFLRKRLGINSPPPMRFSERCYIFGTKKNNKLLSNSIEKLPSIKSVIYTGAWFTSSILELKKENPSIKWYCDTHDVFFVLDRDSNKMERRFVYSPERQKRHELMCLNSTDGVIAISGADKAALETAGCTSSVMVESGSFSHAARGVDIRKGPKELVFGFIGTNNSNNIKCLQIVRMEWWPAIVARHPEARLLLAGSICKSHEATILKETFPDAISSLGFVDVLSDFYVSVQAMLSPIAVQGGLNFKSVEALMAGRPLLTNELGSRCIGSYLEGVCIIDEDGTGIDAAMDRLKDGKNIIQWRQSIHQQASMHFSDNVAYKQLVMKLRGEIHS
ncbi:MAG: glycosyltransferase [Polaromonas sp.]|nr:glycosyltransferase [Polaromonas sp.]